MREYGQIAVIAALLALQFAFASVATDPFAFFGPSAVVGADARDRLERGEAVAWTLPAGPRTLALFGAIRIAADGDRLVDWARDIAALKRSAFVLEIGRFSDPPRIEDLDNLTFDADDLRDLRRCRPASCAFQLSDAEIESMQQAVFNRSAPWRLAALHGAFRALVLRRAEEYLAHGRSGPPPPPFLLAHWPPLAAYMEHYPRVAGPEVETYLYWSKERMGGRAVVSVTHVSVARGARPDQPDALIVGRQVCALRYIQGAWAFTAVVSGGSDTAYLAYLNQSEVSALGGFFGGLVRFIVERRVRSEATEVLQGLRRRLESGGPPRPTEPHGGPTMKLPVEIKFRHMRPSEWIDADLRKRAGKLCTYCRRIHSCHVVVEIPHRHHETGNRFHVSLDLVVPGEEIAVTRSANLHASTRQLSARAWAKAYEVEGMQKDIRVVIRDTFDVARRRLQEYERRRRGQIKTHQRAFRAKRQERIAS